MCFQELALLTIFKQLDMLHHRYSLTDSFALSRATNCLFALSERIFIISLSSRRQSLEMIAAFRVLRSEVLCAVIRLTGRRNQRVLCGTRQPASLRGLHRLKKEEYLDIHQQRPQRRSSLLISLVVLHTSVDIWIEQSINRNAIDALIQLSRAAGIAQETFENALHSGALAVTGEGAV